MTYLGAGYEVHRIADGPVDAMEPKKCLCLKTFMGSIMRVISKQYSNLIRDLKSARLRGDIHVLINP